MGAFTASEIVILPFPFSNLIQNKYRPALLLAQLGQGDWLVRQITSKSYDKQAIEINQANFFCGSLQRVSFARAGKLFTAHESLFSDVARQLTNEKFNQIKQAVIALINGNRYE
jgi:mRNA interferase MazF